MKFTLLFGLCLINLIHGKYLLVDVDDTQNNPIEPNGNRCIHPPCDDTQNSQITPNENRCIHPPCDDTENSQIQPNENRCFNYPWCQGGKRRGCIPHGGKCSGKTMFSINIEFSARNSESGPQCCAGSSCVKGLCIQRKMNINGAGKVLRKGKK